MLRPWFEHNNFSGWRLVRLEAWRGVRLDNHWQSLIIWEEGAGTLTMVAIIFIGQSTIDWDLVKSCFPRRTEHIYCSKRERELLWNLLMCWIFDSISFLFLISFSHLLDATLLTTRYVQCSSISQPWSLSPRYEASMTYSSQSWSVSPSYKRLQESCTISINPPCKS